MRGIAQGKADGLLHIPGIAQQENDFAVLDFAICALELHGETPKSSVPKASPLRNSAALSARKNVPARLEVPQLNELR